LEDIFRSLEWESYGISINGLRLNNLRFADDIIRIGKTKEELARMGTELLNECEKRGLVPNKIKTKYMSNNPDSQMDIDETIIEKVEDRTYLGQEVSFRKGMEKELRTRNRKAWKTATGPWRESLRERWG